MILRRAAASGKRQHAPESGSYAFAGWVLKTGERALVDREGVSVPLSTGEYNLLHALALRPRQVLTRDQLLDLTQGREAMAFDRAIDNQVSRLRRKIETDAKTPELIKTVWGGGYTLAAGVVAGSLRPTILMDSAGSLLAAQPAGADAAGGGARRLLVPRNLGVVAVARRARRRISQLGEHQ